MFAVFFLAVPFRKGLWSSQNCGRSTIDGFLNVIQAWLKHDLFILQLNVNLEKWLQFISHNLSFALFLPAHSVFHGIEGILSGIQQSLIQIPEIIVFDFFLLLLRRALDVRVKQVVFDDLNQVINSSFNFDVLRHQELLFRSDVVFLHSDELVQSDWFWVLRKVDQQNLADHLQVVFNSVLDDVVDGDDQLLELVQALMHVLQIRVDVHGGPSEGHHTGPQFEL